MSPDSKAQEIRRIYDIYKGINSISRDQYDRQGLLYADRMVDWLPASCGGEISQTGVVT